MEKINCRNIAVLPYQKPWFGGPDPSVAPLHARVLRRNKPDPAESYPKTLLMPQKIIKGKCLYGGGLLNHFGHIFLDTIIRLWAYDNSYDYVIFPLVNNCSVPDYFFDILKYFGIPKDKCLFLNQAALIEYLDFAEPFNSPQLPPQKSFFEYSRQCIEPKIPCANSPIKKVFFGRAHLIGKGNYMGEGYFSKLLLDAGFVYVKPELLTIEEQLSVIKNAEVIVFSEGSAIFPLLLLSNINKVYMLPRRKDGGRLFAGWISPRCKFFSVLGDREIERKTNESYSNNTTSPSFLLNPISLFQDLANAGLINPSCSFDIGEFLIQETIETVKNYRKNWKLGILHLSDIYNKRQALID